jgi:hypothetical protein
MGSRFRRTAATALLAIGSAILLNACEPPSGASRCAFSRSMAAGSATVAPVVADLGLKPRPKPKPKPTKQRTANCTRQNSPTWKGYTSKRNGWKTDGSYYYKWDNLHNDIEKYDRSGRHLGSVDPSTGKVYRGRQATHDLTKAERNW